MIAYRDGTVKIYFTDLLDLCSKYFSKPSPITHSVSGQEHNRQHLISNLLNLKKQGRL
jgi:hypothetical protein